MSAKMILEHIGISVRDLDRSVEFYTRVIGCQLVRKTTTSAYLHLDGELMELMQSQSPGKTENPVSPDDWSKKMHGPVGLSHIGFRVDDLDTASSRIRGLGGHMVIPPFKFEPQIKFVTSPAEDKLRRAAKPPEGRTWWRIAVFSDPDGTILELVER
jgi:catechol 2,3-dioxygenase-like lactoylglutathione lyase family enzyme